jgi:hypothetical protein
MKEKKKKKKQTPAAATARPHYRLHQIDVAVPPASFQLTDAAPTVQPVSNHEP